MARSGRNKLKRSVSAPTKMDPGPYEAIVVSNLDPTYMGTLQVELLKSNSSGNVPERTGMLFEVKYLSPFYGVTSQAGLKDQAGYENSQSSYGMWMVPPDVGNRVLVLFVEGNSGQGFWFGCVQDAYMNFMMPGNAATKLVKTDDEDFPRALDGKKLPVSEYNKTRVGSQTTKNPTTFTKPVHKRFATSLMEQGLIDDDIRGPTSSSARREAPSSVFGISTPGPLDKTGPKAPLGPYDSRVEQPVSRLGGSSFVMDDGDDKFVRKGHAKDTPMEYVNVENGDTGGDPTLPHNDLVRIRTRTGHQILLHNTEDLIYIANSRGTAWLEFTSNGKIDIYCADSMSVHSENDINFTADRDINLTAGERINMNSGSGTNQATGGKVSIVSSEPISFTTPQSIEFNSNSTVSITGREGVSIVSETDAVSLSSAKSFSFVTQEDISFASKGAFRIGAEGDMHIRAGAELLLGAHGGRVHISASDNVQIESQGGEINAKAANDVVIESGNVVSLKSANNMLFTSGVDTVMQSGANLTSSAGATATFQAIGGEANIFASGIANVQGATVELNPGISAAGDLTDAFEALGARPPGLPLEGTASSRPNASPAVSGAPSYNTDTGGAQ